MDICFSLVGNPNSGKTTLFNTLTGRKARVGNWSGVTVEKNVGRLKQCDDKINLIDLPGIPSLSPFTEDEIIARNAIIQDKPNLIINIVDATNLAKSLYLTTQLMELNIPIVVALNMMDEVAESGDKIDAKKLAEALGMPVIPISAKTGEGLPALIQACTAYTAQTYVPKTILENFALFTPIGQVMQLLLKTGCKNVLYNTIKLVEGDRLVKDDLYLAPSLQNEIERILTDFLSHIEYPETVGKDFETMISESRYHYADRLVSDVVTRSHVVKAESRTDRVDRILLHKVFAIPIFLLIMFVIFQITFGAFGSFLTDLIDVTINQKLASSVHDFLVASGASEMSVRFIVDGIFVGVGTVLTFLPQVTLLFFFLSFMEDTGYTARTAFMMDSFLQKMGLSGRSFIPMLMGFGCSVPAIMSCRSLKSESDRRITMLITPFMSCGARLPVYAVFAGALFAKGSGLVVFSLYVLGIVVAIFSSALLSKTILKGEQAPFIMDLPPYRMPKMFTVLFRMYGKSKDFVVRAGTIMLLASIVIWFLQTYDIYFQVVEDNSNSMFAAIGAFMAPFFAPLGFGTWQASVALLTGVIAKEAVVSTLAILYNAPEESSQLLTTISQAFTPLSAYAYMVFVLLYMPCVAAFATIARELNSFKWTFFSIIFQTGVAWIAAFLIYNVGRLIGL